jgi:drug/metabolite transporter (DMT)-like permease
MDPKEEAVAIADLVAQKQAEPEPATETMGRAVGGAIRGYRLLRLVAAALVCIGLGLLLILVPDLRDNPRTISLNDVGRGLCAGLVGLVLVALVFISTRRSQ